MLSSRLKAHLIVLSAFILGVAAGASGQYLMSFQSPTKSNPSVAEITQELTEKIKLDPSQRSQVERILDESNNQYLEMKGQMRSRSLALRDATRGRIKALLTPEQRTAFDQWTSELDARREKHNSEKGKYESK
jgi:Spy/CpxP family protein refolding chaperone